MMSTHCWVGDIDLAVITTDLSAIQWGLLTPTPPSYWELSSVFVIGTLWSGPTSFRSSDKSIITIFWSLQSVTAAVATDTRFWLLLAIFLWKRRNRSWTVLCQLRPLRQWFLVLIQLCLYLLWFSTQQSGTDVESNGWFFILRVFIQISIDSPQNAQESCSRMPIV